MVKRHPIAFAVFAGARYGLHFCGLLRRIRFARRHRDDVGVRTDIGPRVCDCPECPRYLWPIDLGEHHFDIFHLYIRQYGDGHRAIAGCRGTVAFGELWGHVLGDYSGWFRYPHVCTYP